MAKENMVKKQVNKTRSYIQYCRSLEIQLPGMLFVTIFEWFSFTNWPFKTGQDNRNSLEKGDHDCLIEGDRLIW